MVRVEMSDLEPVHPETLSLTFLGLRTSLVTSNEKSEKSTERNLESKKVDPKLLSEGVKHTKPSFCRKGGQ